MELDLQQYLGELETLVNIDSVSSQPSGADRIAAFMKGKFQSIGWTVEEVQLDPSVGPCLTITNRPAQSYDVLLLAHMDTVFPIGTAAKRPFRTDGVRAYGPGVIDCKGGMLSGFYALKALDEKKLLQNASICVFLNSDHEGISSKFSAQINRQLSRRSRYALVLEAGRANGNLVYKRKGIARYEATFHGVAAHAGVDFQKGHSAVEEMAHWILALQSATDLSKETTVNVGRAEGGVTISAVPGEAHASIDIRYYEKEEVDRVTGIMNELAAHPRTKGTHAEYTGGITRPPMLPSEKTMQLCHWIDMIGSELGIPFGWMASGGGSDGSFAAETGTPTIDGLGPVGGGAHSDGEYMEIDTVIPRYRLLCRTIEKIIASS
ncbi:M20 family metallopeptidase [Selenomonas sp. TAMA-11512]|uniref:M20 family metallopeptidase n=1 Tax=Selenomonas sp. TAMA-11512 TaxID=3095337 RepID=UPI00308E385F|nr:M20 family metallopeptidase [Selenomonas sp. TAMA-11512]